MHKSKLFFAMVVLLLGGAGILLAQETGKPAEVTGIHPVTFQVDMAVQIFEKKFNPATDTVNARGTFNNWVAGVTKLLDADGDSIYSTIVDFPDSLVGKEIEYKYYYKSGTTEVWEGDPNRKYKIPAGSSSVPLDFFDRDSKYDLPLGEVKTANLTFQVDMSTYISRGVFTANDTLVVRGSFNSWGGYADRLTPQFGQPTLYSVAKSITDNVNRKLEYKFVMKLAGVAGDVWEDIPDNRAHIFTGTDITLSKVTPKFTDPRPTKNAVTRTFVVNAKPLYRRLAAEKFILDVQSSDTVRAVNSIHIAGPQPPFNGWPWGNIPEAWRLYDDGTHNDAKAGDSLFTATFNFPVGSPRETPYKYGGNTRDIEAGFARNHNLTIDDNVLSAIVRDVWGSPDPVYAPYTRPEDFTVSVASRNEQAIPTVFDLRQNYPNPFNPETAIVYAVPRKAHVRISIYNMLGQEVVRLVDEEKAPGNYQALWNGRNQAGQPAQSGVYIYRMTAGSYTRTLKMLLLK
jgi:hypothetical protein